jgi:hypothetical protein
MMVNGVRRLWPNRVSSLTVGSPLIKPLLGHSVACPGEVVKNVFDEFFEPDNHPQK